MNMESGAEKLRRENSFTSSREIGPKGTLARLVAGVVVLGVAALTGDYSTWNVGFGIGVLPLVALATVRLIGMFERRQPLSLHATRPTYRSGPELLLLGVVVVVVIGVSFVTPVTEGAILIWLGASFLLSAVQGHAGCEMVSLSNVLARRQDRLPCFLFNSIDEAEA